MYIDSDILEKGTLMSNVMVCVTKQKDCQRLILYGKSLCTGQDDKLYVIHVAGLDYAFLSSSEDGRALSFLYEKAHEAGAELTVVKSDDVLETLTDAVFDKNIDTVVVGATHEVEGFDIFLSRFEESVSGKVKIDVVSE